MITMAFIVFNLPSLELNPSSDLQTRMQIGALKSAAPEQI